MAVKEKLREYVLDSFLFTDDQSALSNNDSFLEQRILDSSGIMEMIYFIEDEFGIVVDDEEMLPENLDSIDRLVAFIDHKKAE